jgi:RHS repeat-associated protein
MLYDGDGNRVAKTVGSVTTHYLVDDLNPTGYPQVVEELTGSGSGTVARQYTYGLERISENQWTNNTWTPSFYAQDGSGSVRRLTNSARAVTDTYDYDAFGNKINSTGTTTNNYLYRGEQYDSDLGLYYLRARYYNPNTGRFMSRDPEEGKAKDPKSLHKYLYAGSNPINWMDPTGRNEEEDAEIEAEVEIKVARPLSKWGLEMAGCFLAYALYIDAVLADSKAGTIGGLGAIGLECYLWGKAMWP